MAAAISMLSAMVVIGVIDNYVTVIAGSIGLWQFYLIRMLMALPLVWLMARAGLGSMRPVNTGRVALRSLLVAVSMLFYFASLAVMPIAQALAGLFTSPIFVLLISVFGMGHRIGPWRILAVGLGFSGALLVLQPDPQNFSWVTLMPMAGGFFYALGALATRVWCAGESTVALLAGVMGMQGAMGIAMLVVLWALGVGEAEGALAFVTRGWVWDFDEIYVWLVVQCVGSVVGVFLIIRAYQLSDASYVAVFEYSVMIFGPLFGWLVFAQALGFWQMVGVALIAVAGGIIALRSR
jgi:drug/metabolite transporter (DMT)-like permease